MPKYFVVTDELMDDDGVLEESALIGIFTTEKKADAAVKAMETHWEKFEGGSVLDRHEVGYFEFTGDLDRVTIPDFDHDAVGGDDDDESEDDEDEDDESEDDEDEDDD